MTSRLREVPQRRSLGGQVVEDGLAMAGFAMPVDCGVALVETVRPGRHPFATVLAQNAWNVVPRQELHRRLAEYPRTMWARTLARRALGQLNLRRAEKVVCLSEAMARMCAPYARIVEVAAVTVPLDFLYPGDQAFATVGAEGNVFVPGTVTWYKNPLAAVNLTGRLIQGGADLHGILFGGSDDGSGCWPAVQRAARRANIPCRRQTLDRSEMRAACSTAGVVAVLSHLESLSFSMAESLLLSSDVVASRLPAHVEIANRLARQPRWISDVEHNQMGVASPATSAASREVLAAEWNVLGAVLGLALERAGK